MDDECVSRCRRKESKELCLRDTTKETETLEASEFEEDYEARAEWCEQQIWEYLI